MFRAKMMMLIVPTIVGIALVMAPTTPVWAMKDKVLVCHYDDETGEQSLISVSPQAAEAHDTNHPNDTFPVTQEEAEACDGSKVLVCQLCRPHKNVQHIG